MDPGGALSVEESLILFALSFTPDSSGAPWDFRMVAEVDDESRLVVTVVEEGVVVVVEEEVGFLVVDFFISGVTSTVSKGPLQI